MCKKKGKSDSCLDSRPLGQVIKDLNKQQVPEVSNNSKKNKAVGHRRSDSRNRDRQATVR